MLCDNCKTNTAAVFIEQITNGEKTELNVCHKCSMDISNPLFLTNILKGMFYNTPSTKAIHCPNCDLSLSEFKQSGKLGCETCYPTFATEIKSILRNIQWDTSHKGKIPKKNSVDLILKKKVQSLKAELKHAVDQEEYEEAARLRDKIKELEKGVL